jgi:DNA mismatch endonuclease (patch repair protein)
MQANRARDTRPEIVLRSELNRFGLRFRKHYRPVRGIRGGVDIAFTRWKLAVFVDGCFWHGCPDHGSIPVTNAEWWGYKLQATRSRDKRNDDVLLANGWRVLHAWEHEPVAEVIARVQAALRELRSQDAHISHAARRSAAQRALPPQP